MKRRWSRMLWFIISFLKRMGEWRGEAPGEAAGEPCGLEEGSIPRAYPLPRGPSLSQPRCHRHRRPFSCTLSPNPSGGTACPVPVACR